MNVCPTTNSLLNSTLGRRKKLICQSYHGFLSLTFGMSCDVTAYSMNQYISLTTKTRFKLKGVTISTTRFCAVPISMQPKSMLPKQPKSV